MRAKQGRRPSTVAQTARMGVPTRASFGQEAFGTRLRRIPMTVDVRQLSSGYVHIRGRGPCNWAQPPHWPCDEQTLRRHAFPEASEAFIQEALRLERATAAVKSDG